MELEIGEIILEDELQLDELQLDVEEVYPELEDLEVTPTSIEQNFNHPNSYGYDNVKVKAVSTDSLEITPSTESQQYVGLYGQVDVNPVTSSIDSNIQAGNIKQGVNILGVTGTFKDQANDIIDKSITTLDITTDLIGTYALRGCDSLETINAPNLSTIATYGCYACSNLENINTNSNVISLSSYSFYGCSNLEDLNVEYSSINTATFNGCSKITKVICTNAVAQIATSSVFTNCTNLKTLVFRRTSAIVTLKNANSFDNTPFRDGTGGVVYVPNALISSYQSATNWSALESVTFKKIEGSIYE